MRGRNRTKGPNPLTRSFESNGPDVKIRGTAQHIAEKYTQLARDAQSSGDPVAAENYLQHAEHYFRIIAAAQEQFRQQNPGFRPFELVEDDDADEFEDGAPFGHGAPQPEARFPQPSFQPEGDQPRPFPPREPRADIPPRTDGASRADGPPRDNRFGRPRRDDFGRGAPRPERDDAFRNAPRGERQEGRPEPRMESRQEGRPEARQDGPRQDGPRHDGSRRDGRPPFRPEAPRADAPRPESARPEPARAAPEIEDEAQLPAFITAPVRAPVAAGEDAPEAGPDVTAALVDEDAARFPLRQRRRRRSRAEPGSAEAGAGEAPALEVPAAGE